MPRPNSLEQDELAEDDQLGHDLADQQLRPGQQAGGAPDSCDVPEIRVVARRKAVTPKVLEHEIVSAPRRAGTR